MRLRRTHSYAWSGDALFLLQLLVTKDFKIRYRNMSLGMFWSLANPLVMMGVLTFVFTRVFPNKEMPDFPLFFLCGLVPFNFFSVAWNNGTTSVSSSVQLVKRIPIPREIIPIASVLSATVPLTIQGLLLLFVAILFGHGFNSYWFWIPLLWVLEVIFVTGLVLATSGFDVYLKDMRYIVESACTVLFWLVPIFYSLDIVPREYVAIYEFNPVAALVVALRRILIGGVSPNGDGFLVYKLTLTSGLMFVVGLTIYSRLKRNFFDYL